MAPTRNIFDPGGRTITVLADNTNGETISQTVMDYDGADRNILITDALNNTVANTFDADSNLVGVTRTELPTISGAATETFSSAMFYDCLNQMVLAASQGADGNLNPNIMGLAAAGASFWDMMPWNLACSTLISCMAMDSRGNSVLSVDPKANSVVAVFDGASRTIQTQQHLRQYGQGANPPAINQTLLPASAGTIVTSLILDGNSRIMQLIDDRGAVTRSEFDTLDRETKMIFQDGSSRTNGYDEASNVVNFVDENDSAFANSFDALSRKVQAVITPSMAMDVATTTTLQTFEFDGLSRVTFAHNEGVSDSNPADVALFYDSLSRVLEDSQTFGGKIRNVTNSAFLSYPAVQFTFPLPASGGARFINSQFDSLYRRQFVQESSGANIALWNFVGPPRVSEVQLGAYSNLTCTWMNNARTNSAVQGGSPGVPNPPWVAPPAGQSTDRLGYDGAGRMITKRYIASYSSPSAIVGFTTGFDRASNKLYERALHAENRSHLYEPYDAVSNLPTGGYDSLDRLLQYQRGTLSSTGGDGGNGGGSIAVSGSTTQYINLSGTDFQRSYALDSLGNWRNTAFTPSTTGTPTPETEIRQHNLLNEITRINNPAATPVTINPTYDLNGNLTSAGTPAFTWDALNRLATASPGGAYYYDALNRRVSKTVSDVQTDFIYSGWRCVEDRNPDAGGGDGPIAQYVWGRYLDELLQITTLVYITTGSGDSSTAYSPGTYFPLQDMLYRTTATVTISEDGVAIVEAYDFDAYGHTLIFNAVGSSSTWWDPDARQVLNSLCQFLFTGQRFDAESGLYYYKRRMYSAELGRFLSKDPIGLVAGDANLYRHCSGNPCVFVDPFGDAIEIEPILGYPDKTTKFVNSVKDALQTMCPCVEVNTVSVSSNINVIKASPRRVKDIPGGDFCGCLKEHTAGCTLLHDLLYGNGLLKIEFSGTATDRWLPDSNIVRWNPHYQGVGPSSNPTIVLAHELTHSWTHQQVPNPEGSGTHQRFAPPEVSLRPNINTDIAAPGEQLAVRVENQVGREMLGGKYQDRTKYFVSWVSRPRNFKVPTADESLIKKCTDCDTWRKDMTKQ